MKMDIESLICDFKSVDIKEDRPYFILNNNINVTNIKFNFVTDVSLDFYQVWSMFNKIPIVHENGKIKYEWRFVSRDNQYIFVLCDWNNTNNFINTKKWRVLSNTKDSDINNKFLGVLCEALQCYNEYYKESIESHRFTSDDTLVNYCLQKIKKSLIKHKDILRNL